MAAMPPYQTVVREAKVSMRPQLSPDLFASCPLLCAAPLNALLPLPIQQINLNAECHISTAFVQFEMICYYPSDWKPSNLYFFLPKTYNSTISDLVVDNTVRDCVYATAVVPNDEARNKYSKGSTVYQAEAGPLTDLDSTDPELFTLALPQGVGGDQFRVRVMYFLPLSFENGRYMLRIPTTIPYQALVPGLSLNEIMDIHVIINTGVPEPVSYAVESHPYMLVNEQPGHVELTGNRSVFWENQDVELGYQVWGNAIVASVTAQDPEPFLRNTDPRGAFCLTLSPPAPDKTEVFPKSVVFIIDRSGSMTGEPMAAAKDALLTGLEMLAPQDRFAVVAFDHEQMWWQQHLAEATFDNVERCKIWVHSAFTARGLTDIMSPLQQALEILRGSDGSLPYVFLLTDGAVDNERLICHFLASVVRDAEAEGRWLPRVSTFAIGPYCNHFFLKQLSVIGRGMFDMAFRPHSIQIQMERMLLAASAPVLTGVTLSIPGLTSCELYPFPIPDLFCGLPLLITGKFEGVWPESIQLNGTLPDGQLWSQKVYTTQAGNMPLHKVFAKQQLDMMTARAWLEESYQMVQQVVNLSVATGVPCAHTSMVGFETNHAQYQQVQKQKVQGKKVNVAKYAIGGAAAVVILGGVAAALTFGDLAATAANSGVGGGDIGGLIGGDCCGCDCCGDCGECCASMDGLLDCFCACFGAVN